MKHILILSLLFFVSPVFGVDYITQDIIGGCDTDKLNAINNTANLYPIFRVNTYTCESGYFLPANTLGCRLCPSGYTCNGGTFNFNPRQSQGINSKNLITASTQYTCSTNFLSAGNNVANMIPLFTPNTINIEYDNGDGTTSQTTCVYDDLLTLPTTVPTRPGYTFGGWRVKEN